MTRTTIKTKYQSSRNGTGVIVAKGAGKQRTVQYDHALNPGRNHGAAAGTLASALGLTALPDMTTIMVEHDKGRATFVLN